MRLTALDRSLPITANFNVKEIAPMALYKYYQFLTTTEC
jgi:hypothetical protein